MYFVYILYSQKCNRYYIGFSADVLARLERHNAGKVTAAKNCRPYVLKAAKEFPTETDARKEEYRLKKMKSRVYLEKLIEGNWQIRPDQYRGTEHIESNESCFFVSPVFLTNSWQFILLQNLICIILLFTENP